MIGPNVDAGLFHNFHCAWITHLTESLNEGLLPEGYYALAEQHAGRLVPNVLTLQMPEANQTDNSVPVGALEVAVVPPRIRKRTHSPEETYRLSRRTVTIRRTRGHRIVALIEIASPGNKDRPESVSAFVRKVASALEARCHVVVVDLFPPGMHDPGGLHGAFWGEDRSEDDENDDNQEESLALPSYEEGPMALASYVATRLPEAYVARLAVGETLPEMPLFLTLDAYIPLPLEPTYQAAYRGIPAYWRGVIESPRSGT